MKEEKVVEKTVEKAIETRCPSCTASIKFNPKKGKWKCDYCGSEYTQEEMAKEQEKLEEAGVEEKTAKKVKDVPKDKYSEYVSYHCDSCGAEIIADEQTSATFCVYCGNTAILRSKLSGEFSPSRLIPFKKTKEDAENAFKNLLKGKPLAPKDFNKPENIEKIRGIYIPFWLYDINVSGNIEMKGTKVTTWTRGDTHYTKTDTYSIERAGTVDYESIPVDASTRFDNDIMNSLEPFDFSEMIPYNHAYLSGFYAEKYDEESDKVFKEANDRAINSTKELLENDVHGYATKVLTKSNLDGKNTNTEYVLLPVWMVNVKYKDKMHIFAMNGQTGEFIGNIPIDKKKRFIYFISILLITALIIFIIGYITYKTGGYV